MRLRPKETPSQAGFIHFIQTDNTFVRNLQDKENRCLGVLIHKESQVEFGPK